MHILPRLLSTIQTNGECLPHERMQAAAVEDMPHILQNVRVILSTESPSCTGSYFCSYKMRSHILLESSIGSYIYTLP